MNLHKTLGRILPNILLLCSDLIFIMFPLEQLGSLLANTKQLYNICITSAQRLRRWFNIVQMLFNILSLLGLAFLMKMTKS